MHMLITRGVSNGQVEQHARCVKRTGGTTLTMCQTDGWNNTRGVSNQRVEQHAPARVVPPVRSTHRACYSARSFDTRRVLNASWKFNARYVLFTPILYVEPTGWTHKLRVESSPRVDTTPQVSLRCCFNTPSGRQHAAWVLARAVLTRAFLQWYIQ